MAAYVASTNVGEARRSDRANAISYVVRDFNKTAAYNASKKRGKKVSRVEGGNRVRAFAKHIDHFHKKVDRARAAIGDQCYKDLIKFVDGDANKISRVDLEARKDKYSKGVNKIRKTTKSETNTCGMDVPAEMDGGLKMKDIQKKYETEVDAEIVCRRIELPVDEDGKRKPCNQLSMKEKRDLLRIDQMKMLAGELKAGDGIRPSDVKYIVPKSAAMKALVLRINGR